MSRKLATALSIWLLILATSLAQAQPPTRTWVSASGSDANDCSRATPCATFAGALGKSAVGGEIRALDAGLYGTATLTITKSITIDGGETLAAMSAVSNAIVVNAGNNDIVILRNLAITTTAPGLQPAISFENGKQLIVERLRITGVNSMGVAVVGSSTGSGSLNLVVNNSTISSTKGGGVGVRAYRGNAFVTHTVITGMGYGLLANGTGVINADSNVLTGNQTAVQAGSGSAADAAATIRLSNNDIYHNRIGFGCGGGVLVSAGNNRKGSNVNTVPDEPVCSPTAAITQQ